MSPEMALFGHGAMSDLSPLSGEERKSNFGAAKSVDDPSPTSARLLGLRLGQPHWLNANAYALMMLADGGRRRWRGMARVTFNV
jgi:hypothetical protein